MQKNKRLVYLVELAVLLAILIMLEVTGLGMFKTFGLELTILQIPVVIGAIVLGPSAGAILGCSFGLLSFWECFGKSQFGATLLGINPFLTFLVCVPTRALMGWLCGLIFKGLDRRLGGGKADFDDCLPIFQAMGTNITYFGPAGCGQHAKMANQIMIAGTLSGVCEALTYAKAEGLDWNTLLGAVATGAAGSRQLDFQGKKILNGDFAPGFFMKHFVKDMKLAEEEAEAAGLDLNVLHQALSNCQELVQEGCGDLGTQALIKFYEQ